jgi:hypothetical protein
VSGLRSSSFVILVSGWVRKTCGSFWKIVGDRVERLQRVRGHEEVELAGGQQDAIVGVGSTGHDGDVEAVFLVGAVGHRLEETAMFGLRDPVGSKRHVVEGLRARRDQRRNKRQKTCG